MRKPKEFEHPRTFEKYSHPTIEEMTHQGVDWKEFEPMLRKAWEEHCEQHYRTLISGGWRPRKFIHRPDAR